MNCSKGLTINGDIAGPGVRLSFYIQNLILVLLIERSHHETENALWTFVATSFGLTIAALAQVASGHLTFLDAVLVSQLVWFANLGTFFALASYSRSKGQDIVIKFGAVLQSYFTMVLTIAMWVLADRLPCRQDFYFVVMFGVPLNAFGAGRTVALVFASLTLAAYIALTGFEFWTWFNRGRLRLARETVAPFVDVERHAARGHTRAKAGHNSNRHSHLLERRNHASRHHGHATHDNLHQRWFPTDVGSVFFGILVSQLVIFVYFITTTELIIKKSGVSLDPSSWGFGQVLSMTVVIPSIVALWRAARAKLRNKHDTKNGHPRLRAGRDVEAMRDGQGEPSPSPGLLPATDRRDSLTMDLEGQ